MYGFSYIGEANTESGLVSRAMIDYWVSFVASGTPNDGKGLPSACCGLIYALDFVNGGVAYCQGLSGRSTNLTIRCIRLANEATCQLY